MSNKQKIVLASSNVGKIAELTALLKHLPFDIILQDELNISAVEETGLTFVENALLKARHASNQSGLPAIADDSGLAVEALQGRPGIYSARYAKTDAEAIDKLVLEMQGQTNRRAAFCCVIVFLKSADDPLPLICQGLWQGEILHKPEGLAGFGYDPIFFVPSQGCSAANLDAKEKNRMSHRGQALAQLMVSLVTGQPSPGNPQ